MDKPRITNKEAQSYSKCCEITGNAGSAGDRACLDLLDARRRIAELEQGIAAIGSAMGSDRLTPIEIERLVYEGNAKAEKLEKDAERWRWWMSPNERNIAGVVEGSLAGWSKAEWDAFVDQKIAAQRQKEGE